MKPEDFHIYKERALRGNPWMGMDIEQRMEVIERFERDYFRNLLMRRSEELLRESKPSFERAYIIPGRCNGKTLLLQNFKISKGE